MAEHQYVLSQAADVPERERLALLERTLAPLWQRRLAALAIMTWGVATTHESREQVLSNEFKDFAT